MGLLQKLKSALGLGGTGSSESGRPGDVDVTVEREPSTEDEDAVKGTETASSGVSTDESGADDAESGGPSADEFETLADETDAGESAVSETEPADETGADTADDVEVDGIEEAEPAEETDDTDTAGSTDPVTELNGIGPAYGDRLAGAGIDTVGELAGADAAALADQIDLGERRVAGWIEQANEY